MPHGIMASCPKQKPGLVYGQRRGWRGIWIWRASKKPTVFFGFFRKKKGEAIMFFLKDSSCHHVCHMGRTDIPLSNLTRWICCSMAFWISTRCPVDLLGFAKASGIWSWRFFCLRGNVRKSWVGQIGGFLKVHYNPNPCLDGWISWDFWSFFTRKFFRNPFSSELDPPTSYLCLITGTWGDFSNLQPYVVQYAIVCNEDRQDALILDHKIWGGFIASAIQILAVHQQMVQFE